MSVSRSRLLCFIRFPVFLLLSVPPLAQPVQGAPVLRASATQAYTIWSPDDVCNAPMMSASNCTRDVTCSACLTRTGCAVESTTGKCVSMSRIDATAVTTVDVDVAYFVAGEHRYCDASDDACTACGADIATSSAVCRGGGGCVCEHQCELAEAAAPSCDDASKRSMLRWFFVAIVVGVALTSAIMARAFRLFLSDLTTSVARRDRTRRTHAANPLTMKLDGWRGFIAKEATKDQAGDRPKIKLCSTRLSDETAAPSDLESDAGPEYVAVATPKSGDNGDVARAVGSTAESRIRCRSI